MRKFKFMSKAVVGMMAVAMTMGSLSGVAAVKPIGVYADSAEDADEETDGTLTYPLSTLELTDDTALSDVTPTAEWSDGINIEDYTVTYAVSPDLTETGLTFSTTDGKISGTPSGVMLPTEYTITATAVHSDTDANPNKEISTTITVSVAAKDVTWETLSFGTLTVGDELNKTFSVLGDGAEAIASYAKTEELPAWFKVDINDDKAVVVSGTVAATAQVTGYIKALDADNKLLAWVKVEIPEVKDEDGDSNEDGVTTVDKIDYAHMQVTVKSSDPYVVLEVLKEKKVDSKISNTYAYAPDENKEVKIDLSFLKLKKEAYIRIYGSDTAKADVENESKTPIITVAKQPDKLSFKVDASQSDLFSAIKESIKEGKNKPADFTEEKSLANYDYRSEYGSVWESLKDFKYENAKISGMTIIVHKKATDDAPAGPDAKVKIPAAPKAPSVKVSYKKNTLSVKNGQKVAVLGTGTPTKFADITTQKTINEILAECVKEGAANNKTVDQLKEEGFKLVVITAAKGTKADSVPTIIEVKKAPTLTAPDKITATTDKEGNSVKIEKGTKDGSVKLTVTGTAYTYEYVTGESAPADNVKWKAVKTGTDIKDVTSVWVRIAGVDANAKKEIAGNSVSKPVQLVYTVPGDDSNKPGDGEDEKTGDDNKDAKVDTVTIDVVADGDGYTAPTKEELVEGETEKDLIFKYTATATKDDAEVTDVKFVWDVTASTDDVTLNPEEWVWDQDNGTLTIKLGTELVAGDYIVTAEAEGVKNSNEVKITIATNGSVEP